MRKRVGIIGAGPSGLAMIKELIERGHEVVCFEKQSSLGGVFRRAHDFLRLTGSSLNTAFSSYLPDDLIPPHIWSKEGYLNYLEAYSAEFDLKKHIEFETEVTSIEDCDGIWKLTVAKCQSAEGSIQAENQEYQFDHLAICTGAHSSPRMPDYPGAADFQGKIIHSEQLGDLEQYKGKRVCIVGLGESGSDIAFELAKRAEASCVSSTRGPGYLIPREFGGKVTDMDTTRCHHSLPKWFGKAGLLAPKAVLEKFYRDPKSDDLEILKTTEMMNRAQGPYNNGVGASWQNRFGTKSVSFIKAITQLGTLYKPKIDLLEPEHIVFSDGSKFRCDYLVTCTGYSPRFPGLPPALQYYFPEGFNPRKLFARMLLPRLGNRIAWLGFVRPAVGAIPPMAELQARYFALLVSGERELPQLDVMNQMITQFENDDLAQFPYDATRIPALTDYLRFLEYISNLIGCRPPLKKLFFTDPRAWFKAVFGPINGAQFRLQGPGANPQKARKFLRSIPTMPLPIVIYEFVLLTISKLLNLVGLKAFRTIGL